MNINPKLWGPCSWKFLHYVTLGYPDRPTEQVQVQMANLITSLAYLLPCEKCRDNFRLHINNHPLSKEILSSKQELISWLIKIHNEVNRATGKPEMTTYDAYKLYINGETDGVDNKTMQSLLMILVMIVILFVSIVLLNKK